MSYWLIWQIVEWVLRIVMALIILRRRFTPTTALMWLGIVFVLPEVGVVLYILIGDHRLPRKRIRRYRELIAGTRSEQRAAIARSRVRPTLEPACEVVIRQAEKISDMPILGGNEAELLSDPWFLVQRLVADIDAAEHHAHLLYYIFAPDKSGRAVAEALARAAKRGVKCRLLADDVGSRDMFYDGELPSWLEEQGVTVRRSLPVDPIRRRLARLDLRNHRKLAVIDARVAYTGSQNIVDDDTDGGGEALVVDLSTRLRGPIVNQMQSVFLDDWYFDTSEDISSPDLFPPQPVVGETAAQAVATGPTSENESFVRVILAAITAAQRKLVITTPYFVPDEATTLALQMAAARGVEVDLVVPRRSDHILVTLAGRAHYEPCLEAGVRIHQHQGSMLHSKTVSVDESIALIGSYNIDVRSFYLNFELSVLLYGKEITRQLRAVQNRYIEASKRIDLDAWRNRSVLQRYTDSVASLLSPVL